MADRRFQGYELDLGELRAQRRGQPRALGRIVQPRARSVTLDPAGSTISPAQDLLHDLGHARSRGIGSDQRMGLARESKALEPRPGARATLARMLFGFEDQYARALAEHGAAALGVERPASGTLGRENARRAKHLDDVVLEWALRTARDHDVVD